MSTYEGKPYAGVTIRDEDESTRPLPFVRKGLGGAIAVEDHRWGHEGAGVYQTAWDLLFDVTGSDETAEQHHRDFAASHLHLLPESKGFVLTSEAILGWLRPRLT